MKAIAPDMVLGKPAVDGTGGTLGEIVDVGLYDHSRVKFLLVEDKSQSVPIRRFSIDAVEGVDADHVRVRVL